MYKRILNLRLQYVVQSKHIEEGGNKTCVSGYVNAYIEDKHICNIKFDSVFTESFDKNWTPIPEFKKNIKKIHWESESLPEYIKELIIELLNDYIEDSFNTLIDTKDVKLRIVETDDKTILAAY